MRGGRGATAAGDRAAPTLLAPGGGGCAAHLRSAHCRCTPTHQGSQACSAAAGGARAYSAEPEVQRGADGLILPHGGKPLVNLMASSAAAEAAKSGCTHQVELTERQACDVELLTVG